MSGMPTAIKIGHYEYEIIDWDPEAASNAEAYGLCNRHTLKIYVRADLKPAVKAETLLHEIEHACYYAGNLQPGDDEERIVSILSTQLATAMHNNPEVFRWIINKLKSKPA